MTQWRTTEEVQKDAAVFKRLMHVLLGLYAYECLLSLDFDWAFITGKKKFRWPLIFYFANRYLLLISMIGIAIALDTTIQVDCQALFTFNQLSGDAAVGLASINLSIRTMAIWSQNRYIIGLLVLIILGHWTLILQGIQLRATWVPSLGCTITETNNKILAAIFIYSMCFDLVVLLLNMYKLVGLQLQSSSSSNGGGGCGKTVKNPRLNHTSRLSQMIFADGLIYFFIAFLANLIATIFMVLNLNQIMSVIFNVPAAVFSTIVACRAVRRLTNFSYDGPQMFTSGPNNNAMTRQLTGQNFKSAPIAIHHHQSVHVQMETVTRDDPNVDIFSPMPKRSGSDTDVEP